MLAFALQTRRQWRNVEAGAQPFLIGDWTISYAGGVVRRGFFGWFLLNVAPEASTALPVLWITQTLLYAMMFGVAIWWAMRLPAPLAWAPFLLSPAFLMFGLHDFDGTHRKEIIVLAGLFLLAEAVRSGRTVIASVPVTLALYLVGVLSHEANSFLVLPFVLLIRRALQDGLIRPAFARRASAGFLITSLAGLALAILSPGTTVQRQAICADLISRGFDENLCRGALSYLGESASSQIGLVMLERLPGDFLYVFPALFATIPLLSSGWARAHWKTLALAVAPLAPLFVIAIDWGRWIMLATVVATVLTVVGSSRDGKVPARMPFPILVLFVVGWSVPHYDIRLSDIGPGQLPAEVTWAFETLRGAFLRR